MDNRFPLAGNCCNRYSNRTKSRNWRLRCESMSAVNQIDRPCSSAEHHLRSFYLCWRRCWSCWHCIHSIWTFSHNAHELRHRLRHLSIIHIAVGTQSRPNIWSSPLPSCACVGKSGCPDQDIVEKHISARIIQLSICDFCEGFFLMKLTAVAIINASTTHSNNLRCSDGTYHKHFLHYAIDAEFSMCFMMKQLFQ